LRTICIEKRAFVKLFYSGLCVATHPFWKTTFTNNKISPVPSPKKSYRKKSVEETDQVFRSCRVLRMKLDGEDGQSLVNQALVWTVICVGEQRRPESLQNAICV
jgi:hypothetical protein